MLVYLELFGLVYWQFTLSWIDFHLFRQSLLAFLQYSRSIPVNNQPDETFQRLISPHKELQELVLCIDSQKYHLAQKKLLIFP